MSRDVLLAHKDGCACNYTLKHVTRDASKLTSARTTKLRREITGEMRAEVVARGRVCTRGALRNGARTEASERAMLLDK